MGMTWNLTGTFFEILACRGWINHANIWFIRF